MQEIEISSRLYIENGARYMTATMMCHSDPDMPRTTAVTFILSGHRLVTVRYDEPKPFALVENKLARTCAPGITGEQVIKRENVPEILATMTMAGLYDGSGGWAWQVGLPAKSGVGGGIVAIIPGKGAIAVFAPPLDEAGNSVKAQEVIDYVSDKLHYNLFSPASVGWK